MRLINFMIIVVRQYRWGCNEHTSVTDSVMLVVVVVVSVVGCVGGVVCYVFG